MNRGARRAPVLGSPETRDLFLDVLAELPRRFGVRLHGFAVMPNHFHLLVETPRGNLSRAMRHLGALFTQRLNTRHGWDGPVFRGRFHNRIAGNTRYWMHLLAYLHLNPLPALAARPEDWRWSSHRAYAGLVPTPAFLSTDEMLEAFGSRGQLLAYIEEHRTGHGPTPDDWSEEDLWCPVHSKVPAPPVLDVDVRPVLVRDALHEVSAVTGVGADALCRSLRGRRDNRARWVAAWWLTRRAALTQRLAARYLDCRAPSVSHMVRRAQVEAVRDPELSAWMEALEDLRREHRNSQS